MRDDKPLIEPDNWYIRYANDLITLASELEDGWLNNLLEQALGKMLPLALTVSCLHHFALDSKVILKAVQEKSPPDSDTEQANY